jgi:hypothetical protein
MELISRVRTDVHRLVRENGPPSTDGQQEFASKGRLVQGRQQRHCKVTPFQEEGLLEKAPAAFRPAG